MPENLEPTFGRLLVYNQENEQSIVKLYVSEPTPLEEKNLGRVFILAEIEATEEVYQEVIDLVNDEFNHYYYRSDDLNLESAFEQALQKVNQKLQEAISQIGQEWLNKLNIMIAVWRGEQMHFTHLGTVQAFLIQQNQIINLVDSARAKTKQINPLKIFTNILSGKLNRKSTVVFCTESLLDYLSPEKIKKTVSDNIPVKAADYLEKLLVENGAQNNFAAFILKLSPSAKNIAKAKIMENPKALAVDSDSMDQLVHKEKATTELLSPSLWAGLKGSLQQWKSKKEENEFSQRSSLSQRLEEKPPAVEKPNGQPEKPIIVFLKKILNILKKIGIKLINLIIALIRGLFSFIKRPQEYQTKFRRLPKKTTGKLGQLVEWFKNLSLPRKILLVVAVVAIFVFAQTIVYKGKNQESAQTKTQYEQNIVSAEGKINEAKADLLMNNDKAARQKLNEARDLLSQVPTDDKIYEEKNGAEIAQNLQEQLDKINKVEKISGPMEVADFSQINSQLAVGSIFLIGDNFYAFDANNASVYSSALANKQAKVVLSNQEKVLRTQTKDSAATVLSLFNDGSYGQFNPVLEKYSPVTVEAANQDQEIAALVVYGPRLYALDKKNNQIFKHQKSGDVYETGTAWLSNSELNLNDAVSLAIDGSLYLLKSNGELNKYYGGVKDKDFALASFDPQLTAAQKVFTDENSQNVYILDAANQRLIAVNKNGELARQYTADEFTDLKDMVVDEINKKAYLLNGTKIYQVDLK